MMEAASTYLHTHNASERARAPRQARDRAQRRQSQGWRLAVRTGVLPAAAAFKRFGGRGAETRLRETKADLEALNPRS